MQRVLAYEYESYQSFRLRIDFSKLFHVDLKRNGELHSSDSVSVLVLVALGANIFDNMDLEALAETAARLNQWEFLLVAAPIPNPGGTGSPLNPLAIF